MALLNRDALLKQDALQIVKVDLGNEEFVFVRQMSGRERDRFEQSLFREKKDDEGTVKGYERSLDDFRAKLAVCVLCDENGKLLLLPEDYTILSQHMSASKLERIIEQAQAINKITDRDKEVLVKNLEAGKTGSSTSASA